MNPSLTEETAQPRLLEYVPTSLSRVFVCDCADGAVGKGLKARGIAWVGGATTHAPEQAAARLDDVRYLADRVDELPELVRNDFDGMVLDHILEYRRSPAAFLTYCMQALAPGGFLAIAVPNVQYHKTVFHLAEGRWAPEQAAGETAPPLRFFTAYELSKLARSAGLDVKGVVPLERDPASALPLDERRMASLGRIELGPLEHEAHVAFLTRRQLLIALKP